MDDPRPSLRSQAAGGVMTLAPASIRNNNPGAMYPGKSARKFGSTSFEVLRSRDGVHKIATFPTMVHGAAAQFDLLYRSYCGISVEAAIKRWCGGFYASTYIGVLEEKAGIKRSDLLTKDMLRRSEVAIPIARAMAWQEAGMDYPLDDAGWRRAHDMAFAGDVAPAFTPTNDVPSPRPETRRAEAVRKIAWPTLASIAAGFYAFFDWVMTAVTGAVSMLTSLEPLKGAAAAAGANGRAIAAGVAIAAIGYGISRAWTTGRPS